MGKWLTPDAPDSGYICRQVLIPNLEEFVAIVNGALIDLLYSNSFEQYGDLSPSETAAYFQAMYQTYLEGCPTTLGTIFAHAMGNPPTGSLACDGASYQRVDYPDLYAVLATAFHTDADNFVTPDLRGRVVVGVGTGSGLTARALNDGGGEETHQLSVAELPAHHHGYQLDTWGPFATPGTGVGTQINRVLNDTTDTGSGTAHNTMQPFRALNYAIWAI